MVQSSEIIGSTKKIEVASASRPKPATEVKTVVNAGAVTNTGITAVLTTPTNVAVGFEMLLVKAQRLFYEY